MAYLRLISLAVVGVALAMPVGCSKREPTKSPPPVAVTPPAAIAPTDATAAERQAIIVDHLAKRPWSEQTRGKVVEQLVTGTAGLTPEHVDRLMTAIDSSLAVIAEDHWDAGVRLADGQAAPSGATLSGIFVTGVMNETTGPQPVVINCGRVRATGFIEKVGARNRAIGTITSLAVQRTDGSLDQYQDHKGLAYLSGPDGLDGLTLSAVTDQRNNSWLGVPAGTRVLVVLSRAVDSSLLLKSPLPATAP